MTNKADSIDTELFSLNIRLSNYNNLEDIIEVNRDQKILCKSISISDEGFRCLFMITYDDEDVNLNTPLFVHASSVNQSAVTHIYANFIEKQYYDEYDIDSLREHMPTKQNAEYITEKLNKDYIYTTLNRLNKYLYVSVISDKYDEIFILTSKTILLKSNLSSLSIYPNPISENLLYVPGDKLILKFFTSYSIFVNIVTLGGEAIIKWSNNTNNFYYLKGRGNKLSLSPGTEIVNELIIEKKVSSNNAIISSEEPGFVFYISYYIRNEEYNFDKIVGNSAKIVYKKIEFPIFLYNKIGYCYDNINIGITFKYLNKYKNGEYTSAPFDIKCGISKENSIYILKKYPEFFLIKYLIGKYVPILKTIQIFISKEFFKSSNIKPE